MLNEHGIYSRLADLREYLSELELMRELSFEGYESDLLRRRAIERILKLIIECAIDINDLLIVGSGRRPPKNYRASFLQLGDIGVVGADFSEQLAAMARLRNALAHEYESMSDREIHPNIITVLELFSRYVKEVTRYLVTSQEEE